MSEPFYKNGLHFSCERCSFCCGHSPGFVYLSMRDLKALCAHLDMKVSEFVRSYCRWADYYDGAQVLALRERPNYDCILWKDGCSCYESRPVQCSTYPFWSWMIKDEAAWSECARDCPGMRNKSGKLWSFEEIEASRNAYEANKPLTREQTEELIEQESQQVS